MKGKLREYIARRKQLQHKQMMITKRYISVLAITVEHKLVHVALNNMRFLPGRFLNAGKRE
jgi:hypothetical protein